MSRVRRVIPSVSFNGKNVKEKLTDYLEAISYTDVACGESDSLRIDLQNIDLNWLKDWYPTKGDKIEASILFQDWVSEGANLSINCGEFILDTIGFKGGPAGASFEALSIPAEDSFKETGRTKVWENVTVKGIGAEIAKKYSLGFMYDAKELKIKKVEQSEQSDSAFLYDTCKKYGLAMKVFRHKIIIFDKGKYENKNPVATIKRSDFVDDSWDYKDTLMGTYTGAKASYKKSSNSAEENCFIGFIKEDAKGSRVLRLNEQSDDINDAKFKAAAKVNEANEGTTTISGQIWANPKIVAGATVKLEGFGKPDGKYFVDKVVTSIAEEGATQEIQLHRCQKRLVHIPQPVVEHKPVPPKKKSYSVGDIVNFHGGTHYVSSYPGATGYSVSAGPAKITIANGSGGAHPWHLVTTNWGQTHVYGWVDEGTFD